MNPTTANAAGSRNVQSSRMSLFDEWVNGDLVGNEGARASIISGRSDRVSTKEAKKGSSF